MKYAVSGSSFANAFAAREISHLEWLDLCANELEVDGVVFDLAGFPRTDPEFVAQLKKAACDLGLTVVALETAGFPDDAAAFALARDLGAPLVATRTPAASEDPDGWSAFAARTKARAREAKAANVVLALRSAPGTFCATAADLRRIAYDVDGSWLRYAPDVAALRADDTGKVLERTVLAFVPIDDLARFADPNDAHVAATLAALARFRGFIVTEVHDALRAGSAYHAAIERFAAFRFATLAANANNENHTAVCEPG